MVVTSSCNMPLSKMVNMLEMPMVLLGSILFLWIIIGSDREPLGIGLGIRIADLNQIADLKLSILAPVKFRWPI